MTEIAAAERERSRRLAGLVHAEIREAGGAIGFDRFMELALYAPGLGYYAAGDAQFGEGGDFVTSPELSPLFASCLAGQVAEVLATLGGGTVVELGAGSGRLAADLLAALAEEGAALDAYVIVERSAALRTRQEALLADFSPAVPVRWLEAMPPAGWRGVAVANELLDAMPACRFEVTPTGWQELLVQSCGDGFAWAPAPPRTPGLAAALAALEREVGPLPVGYRSEVGLAAARAVRDLVAGLGRGAAILLDYGYPRREYYHPQRTDGTLRCHFRHLAHDDPFANLGLQDLSVHVDFTAISEAGCAAGARLAGFTTQASFLLAAGLLERVAVDPSDAGAHLELTTSIKRLTLPGGLGELVKAIALTRDLDAPPSGFSGRDHRGRL